MRIAVTGASGFIGTHLERALTRAGHAAIAIPRGSAAAVEHADAIVHLAFPTSAAVRRGTPRKALGDVLEGLGLLSQLVDSSGATRVVLASSGKVYGLPRALPMGEDHELAPNTYLGELKLLQERAVELLARRGGIAATSLRVFNAYGSGQREEFLLPYLLAEARRSDRIALGELHHARDYVHVDDVCRAIVTVLEAPGEPGAHRAFNVGTGVATDVAQIVQMVERALGRRLWIESVEQRQRPNEATEERADVARLCAEGWSPSVDLATGVAVLASSR